MLYAACVGTSRLARVATLLLFATGATAFDCNIEPIVLGIKNASFDNGVPVNRGVQCKLPGNQILGLRLSTVWNNTFISNASNCKRLNSSDENACQGAVGSTFEPVTDDGWETWLPSDWEELVSHVDEAPTGSRPLYGVAEMNLDDGPTIDLPIAVWSNPSIDPVKKKSPPPSRSVLGIGPSSDLIRSLLNGSFVPSSFMGLYFGSRSLDCSEDGELTIGGWDSSRVSEPFVNYTMNSVPINATCPLQVRIKGITLNNDEGSHDLIPDGLSVPACIDPYQNAIGFTDALYAIWANLTQHPTVPDGPPFTNQTYPLDNERLIDTLDIELEGGYTTRISHCELISLQRGADLNGVGDYTVTNSSRIMASVSSGATDLGTNFGVLLGGAFLASTYLKIDYEEGVFGLAKARGPVRDSPKPSLVKVCSKDTSIPKKANDSIAEASSPAALDAKKDTGAGGISADTKATIGGSVAGGIIALIGVVIAYFTYKHAKGAERARKQSEAERLEIELERTRTL